MKSFSLLLIFTLITSVSQAQFQPSFRAGGRDAANQYIGGTEMRVLTAHKGRLFGGLETWEDNNNGTIDPDIGAQPIITGLGNEPVLGVMQLTVYPNPGHYRTRCG